MKIFNRAALEARGVFLPDTKGFIDERVLGMDASMAMDAQPALATQPNAGIPSFLTNYLDPEIVEVVFAPNKAERIMGSSKLKGDWTTQTAMFPFAESTGEVTSYGDYNEVGSARANANWISRESYLFQTVTQWGALELDRAGEARINWAQRQNIASVLVLDKFMNTSWFYGVSGLKNYGLLNDPSLPASITPGAPVSPSTGTTWPDKTAADIFTDIVSLYNQLITQTQGLIERDAKMVLAMSPQSEAQLTKTNQYNVNVYDQIKKNFPNLRIETAVQYENATSGNLVQLIAEEIEGLETVYGGFNEKLRAHPVIVAVSSWKQKKTSGTWGAIIRRPLAIASMLGV
jgi:hypothetical protein